MTQEEEIKTAQKILSDFLSLQQMRCTAERDKIVECIYTYNGYGA
ncbi:MAG TPA: hypothetical protein PLK45_01665 [Paludibacteraceae bacterium]|nr:hypothetical protein [Paludibacteraceae bacterium]